LRRRSPSGVLLAADLEQRDTGGDRSVEGVERAILRNGQNQVAGLLNQWP
jgi:hypothetical protein